MISRASVINRTSIDREHNPADNNVSPARFQACVYISRGDNEVFVDLQPLLHQVFPQARFMRFMHDALIIYCYLYLCLVHIESDNGFKERRSQERRGSSLEKLCLVRRKAFR